MLIKTLRVLMLLLVIVSCMAFPALSLSDQSPESFLPVAIGHVVVTTINILILARFTYSISRRDGRDEMRDEVRAERQVMLDRFNQQRPLWEKYGRDMGYAEATELQRQKLSAAAKKGVETKRLQKEAIDAFVRGRTDA